MGTKSLIFKSSEQGASLVIHDDPPGTADPRVVFDSLLHAVGRDELIPVPPIEWNEPCEHVAGCRKVTLTKLIDPPA